MIFGVAINFNGGTKFAVVNAGSEEAAANEVVHQLNVDRSHVVIIPAAEAIQQMSGVIAFLTPAEMDGGDAG